MTHAWYLLIVAVVCAFAQDTLYVTPKPSGPVVFLETFNDDKWTSTWSPSEDPKYTGVLTLNVRGDLINLWVGDWKVEEAEYVRVSGDRGLVVGSVAKHHAIGALFPTPLDNTDNDLVIQYVIMNVMSSVISIC